MSTPHTSWLDRRLSGLLVHVTSMPGDFGIGNMGEGTRRFIDMIAQAGFAYWQICPVGPTGYGDSPYQSFSTHAGNPYLIDLGELVNAGMVDDSELDTLRAINGNYVDYGELYKRFWPIARKAASRYASLGCPRFGRQSFDEFCQDNIHWLDGYALFMALKELHDGKPWYQWPDEYRDYERAKRCTLLDVVSEETRQKIYQYWFFCQWERIHEYARCKNVGIIGDIPIFVAHDSADVWQNRALFRIDSSGGLKVSAGVPPDYFSEYGQYWGNPLYDWEYLSNTDYTWWKQRFYSSLKLFDVIRLDHFRAFSSFWEIPGGACDARAGRWVRGPGMAFFDSIGKAMPYVKIIAEDLGYIDEEVYRLKVDSGLPGMKVVQFGFGHDANNVNLPHFYPFNSVAYTGTHDNDTTRGWLSRVDGFIADKIRDYFACDSLDSAWPIVRAAFLSVSRLAVAPVQDILDLGSEARMNTPGIANGNWRWRLNAGHLDAFASMTSKLAALNSISDRNGRHMQTHYSVSP